jgi:hypothetical protein
MLLAGGGLTLGQVIGPTNSRAKVQHIRVEPHPIDQVPIEWQQRVRCFAVWTNRDAAYAE